MPSAAELLQEACESGISNLSEEQLLVAIAELLANRPISGTAFSITAAASDETTALTAGTGKVTFRMPAAVTLSEVRASLTTGSSSGSVVVDIDKAGVSILSTKITIEANETTSLDAATQPVISDIITADDARITVDIDSAGTNAAGLKVTLIGTYT
jgi:hypothetical protein